MVDTSGKVATSQITP